MTKRSLHLVISIGIVLLLVSSCSNIPNTKQMLTGLPPWPEFRSLKEAQKFLQPYGIDVKTPKNTLGADFQKAVVGKTLVQGYTSQMTEGLAAYYGNVPRLQWGASGQPQQVDYAGKKMTIDDATLKSGISPDEYKTWKQPQLITIAGHDGMLWNIPQQPDAPIETAQVYWWDSGIEYSVYVSDSRVPDKDAMKVANSFY